MNTKFLNLTVVKITLSALMIASAGVTADARIAGQTLEPTTEQRFATRLASRFLTTYHYARQDLDDELSEKIFEQYLATLDPNRMYFLASDIEQFERYRTHLDDAIRSTELDPPFAMFEVYRERVAERVEHAQTLLQQDFEFDVEESYEFDRSDSDWIATSGEHDELWRKRIKNDWLSLKLAEREADDIRETLGKRYSRIDKRVSEFNGQDVYQFFMNAFARSIEPHSSYMSPRLADNFEISMKLSLDGIGALLGTEDEYVEVQEVIAGGPADLDGRLKAGDRIIGVAPDGDEVVDVVGWRLDDVVDLIRGERETPVRIEVLPAESGIKGPPVFIELVRNEVKLEEQAAKSSIEEVEVDGELRRIGIIDVPVFYVDFRGRARNEPDYRSSTRDVRRLIEELEADGVEGLVIDLRGNGGGALVEATTMTGLFIDEGPVVQVRDAGGRVSIEFDREPGMAWDGPLAVLVDRASASASEIFAAAVQDYGRGIIIGEATFGKGTVQNLFNLDNYANDDKRLGQVKLTMAKFFRIDGGSTQARGVVPDIELPAFSDPTEYGESALDYALEWSRIEQTDYQPLANLAPLSEAARELHLARRETDVELKELIEDYDRYAALRERTSISLLESERLKEHEESEDRRRARFAHSGIDISDSDADGGAGDDDTSEPSDGNEPQGDEEEEESRPDVLLKESARILADLIELDRDQHRLVQFEEPSTPGSLD